MAKPTNFIKACREIEQAIDRATATGSGAHKTRGAMRRDLALWATTHYARERFERLGRLRKISLKRWDTELRMPTFLLASTVRLMALHDFTRAAALKLTRSAPADLDYALALLKDVGLSLRDVAEQQSPEIETQISAYRENLHVRLESRALEDMLLAAAEGYKVSPSKGFKYTEVFGLCFGSVRRNTAQRDSHKLFVNVGRVATQMRAKATASEVTPNDKSLAAHLDIGDRFFPHLEVVGDYHTHPYKTFSALTNGKGWEYSHADENSIPHLVEQVGKRQHRPLFSLIVAIAAGGRKGKGPFRRKRNVVQLPVGDLYFVVGAYRVCLDETYDDDLDLDLPAHIS